MAETTRDKFLNAVNESSEALLTAAAATEDRSHKASKAVLDEVRTGQKELVGLARTWAASPTSFFDNFGAMLDVQTRAQQRALKLARESLTGASEYRDEVQEAFRRVVAANSAATEAVVGAARDTISQAVERVRAPVEEQVGRRRANRAHRVPVAASDEAESAEGSAAG